MTMQSVNIGAAPNDHIGDAIRVAFDKVNDNFTDLYSSFEGVNVKWYGAKGDGITDDTAAIEAAIVANKNIFLPVGTYLCNITIAQNFFNIKGAGSEVTTLKTFNGTDPVITIDSNTKHNLYWSLVDFSIDGNSLVNGIRFSGTLPFACTKGTVKKIFIYNTVKAIFFDSCELYKCYFSDITIGGCDCGIYSALAGAYVDFNNIEITGVNNGGYAINYTGGLSNFQNITTEGVIRNAGINNHFYNTTIETIINTPPFAVAFLDAGANSIVDLTLTSIDHTKCTYGYDVFGIGHVVLNIRAWGTDTPTDLFAFEAGSAGVIVHAETSNAIKAVDYLNPQDYQNWQIGGGNFFAGLLKKIVYSTAAPASGTWAVGDICYNTTPTSGGYIGWVCTTAPGTFKGFGLIA